MTFHAVGNASLVSVPSLCELHLTTTRCSDLLNQITARGYLPYRFTQQISQKQHKLSVEFVGAHKQHIGFNGLIYEHSQLINDILDISHMPYIIYIVPQV